ncbi:MAG: VacJ family lipoprotein [Nitrospirae bacterium YQR-1]
MRFNVIFTTSTMIFVVFFLILFFYGRPACADDTTGVTDVFTEIMPLEPSAFVNEHTNLQLAALLADISDSSTKQDNLVSQKDTPAQEGLQGDDEKTGDLEIADPLESLNRVMFEFNDALYTGVLKPLTTAYNFVVPEDGRIAVDNFFYNLFMPVRFVNAVLQLKFEDAGNELLRFTINSTIGIAGLADFATSEFNLKKSEKDTGQTLGFYGLGHGFYIVWPLLGPKSLRDSFGYVGDMYLRPINYLGDYRKSMAVTAYNYTNHLSLHTQDYETLKEASVDPYLSLRDAYLQHRAYLQEKK